MVSRRSHTKSRHGCSNCKRRRVKCDEQRPFCGNCTQRQDACVYNAEGPYFFAGKQSRRTRQTGSCSSTRQRHTSLSFPEWDTTLNTFRSTNESADSPVLNMEQLQLVIQWIQHTHTFLARNEETRKVWETAVLEEGLKAPFLMHGILGLSALHLSCTRSSEQGRWLSIAISHKNKALSMFSEQLSSINRSNAKAMMSFAGLVVIFGLGSALTPGTDVGPSLDALIEIFTLARGVQAVVNEGFQFLLQSNFAPLFEATPPTIPFAEDVLIAFDHLRELNTQLGQQSVGHDSASYERTIEHLRDMAAFTWAQPTSMTLVGGWAIRAPSQFMSALERQEPFSLVLLAHFCGFLNMARGNWCVGPWGSMVLKEINQLLPSDWQRHTDWPTSQVLGKEHIDSNVSPMEN